MCGLFGIISKEKVNVDKRVIATLGMLNDTRGGDACGLFIDGQIEYGTEGDNVKFYNFFQQSKLFKEAKKANVVLGHCRKASVGGKSADKAQPIVIREGDEIKFVLLHNGTIKNYADLAKKYIPDEDITGLSDTQIMAKIFYLAGYDCLGEYNGGAVFVIADYRGETPEIRLWCGWSKDYSYSKEITPERPLFITLFSNRLAFSSIKEGLDCLYPDMKTLSIKPNTLCKFEDGRLLIDREFDRSNCIQTPTTSYRSSGLYDDDRDYYSNSYGGAHTPGSGKTIYSSCKTKETPKEEEKTTSLEPSFRATQINSEVDLSVFSNSLCVDSNTLRYFLLKKDDYGINRVEFNAAHGRLLHGIYRVSSMGLIQERDSSYGNVKCSLFAFYNGRLLKNVDCYKFIRDVASLWNVEFAEMGNFAPYLIDALSVYPHAKEHDGVANTFFITNPDRDFSEELFSGSIPVIFTQSTKIIESGILKMNTVYTTYFDTFDKIKEECDKFKLNNRNITLFLGSDYD